jgi:hypothetical protein
MMAIRRVQREKCMALRIQDGVRTRCGPGVVDAS